MDHEQDERPAIRDFVLQAQLSCRQEATVPEGVSSASCKRHMQTQPQHHYDVIIQSDRP